MITASWAGLLTGVGSLSSCCLPEKDNVKLNEKLDFKFRNVRHDGGEWGGQHTFNCANMTSSRFPDITSDVSRMSHQLQRCKTIKTLRSYFYNVVKQFLTVRYGNNFRTPEDVTFCRIEEVKCLCESGY